MNIAICDDDKSFRDLLEKHLKNYFDERSIPLNFFQFSSGEDLLKSDMLFDLAFLDVEMEKINGIDTGKALKRKNPHNIIFVITSYEGYLDDAFKIHAFRFLSKPLNVVRLYKALDDAAELINNDIIVFYDVQSASDVRIYTNDIIFIEILENQRIIAENAQFTGIAAGQGVGFTTGLLHLRKGLGMRETPIRPHSWHCRMQSDYQYD